LVALENGTQPAISGRDNLKTMALVDAAYLSAKEHRAVMIEQIEWQARHPDRAEQEDKAPPWWKLKFPEFFGPDLPNIWSNFTPRANKVLSLAGDEARRMRHNFVGTEHLLIGLIRLDQGVAVSVLRKLGLDLIRVRKEIEGKVPAGSEAITTKYIPFTPRVKKVLKLAAKDAAALRHAYIGTEHIFLGLLQEYGGAAAQVFKSLGIDAEQTRLEILRELDPN
jgi:hypothetical protein